MLRYASDEVALFIYYYRLRVVTMLFIQRAIMLRCFDIRRRLCRRHIAALLVDFTLYGERYAGYGAIRAFRYAAPVMLRRRYARYASAASLCAAAAPPRLMPPCRCCCRCCHEIRLLLPAPRHDALFSCCFTPLI